MGQHRSFENVTSPREPLRPMMIVFPAVRASSCHPTCPLDPNTPKPLPDLLAFGRDLPYFSSHTSPRCRSSQPTSHPSIALRSSMPFWMSSSSAVSSSRISAGGGYSTIVVHNLLVAVDAEVVASEGDVGPWDAEGLLRASTLEFRAITPLPTGESIRQVVLGVLLFAEPLGCDPKLVGSEEWGSLVVEAVAVDLEVVEPDVIGAARVGLGEQQDRGGDPSVGLEHAGRQGDDAVELLILDQDATEFLVSLGRAEQHPIGHDDRGPASRP